MEETREEKMEEVIKNIIVQHLDDYEFFGIRSDYKNYNVGDIIPNSHQWWQDDPEDGSQYNTNIGLWDGGELPGACAINISVVYPWEIDDEIKRAMTLIKGYGGRKIYLIASNIAVGGNDIGEAIMYAPEVLAIL